MQLEREKVFTQGDMELRVQTRGELSAFGHAADHAAEAHREDELTVMGSTDGVLAAPLQQASLLSPEPFRSPPRTPANPGSRPVVWLDVSRLLWRVFRGNLTGIDRVELAYAEHFFG